MIPSVHCDPYLPQTQLTELKLGQSVHRNWDRINQSIYHLSIHLSIYLPTYLERKVCKRWRVIKRDPRAVWLDYNMKTLELLAATFCADQGKSSTGTQREECSRYILRCRDGRTWPEFLMVFLFLILITSWIPALGFYDTSLYPCLLLKLVRQDLLPPADLEFRLPSANHWDSTFLRLKTSFHIPLLPVKYRKDLLSSDTLLTTVCSSFWDLLFFSPTTLSSPC